MNAPAGSKRVSPIEKFLGPEAMVFGPLGLLGLTPESCTDERIVVSLEWQLDRVSQHTEGDTPEADEVRLALHAAAAQLLDKNVRRHVLARLGVTMIDAPAGAPAPAPANPVAALEQDAILTLAMYGGWNKRSLQRLGALAHAKGMSSAALAQSLQHLATKRRKPARPGGTPSTGTPARPGETPPARGGEPAEPAAPANGLSRRHEEDGRRYLFNLLLGAGAAFVVVAASTVYLILLLLEPSPGGGVARGPVTGLGTGGGTTATPPAAAPTGPVPASAAGAPSASPDRSRSPAAANPTGSDDSNPAAPATAGPGAKATAPAKGAGYVDPLLVVRTLRDAASRARAEPDAMLARFTAALDSLMSRWCRFDPQQRQAADAAAIDFLYAVAARPSIVAAAMEPVLRAAQALPGAPAGDAGAPAATPAFAETIAPDQVWPAVWSVGFLTRLSRERELSAELAGAVDAALTSAIGRDRPRLEATFENGAVPALRRVPAALVRWYAAHSPTGAAGALPDAAPLAPWIEAVIAIAGTDVDLRERLLADGLEQVLTQGAEPRDDKYVFAAIGELGVEIKWRKGGPARARLLAWFKDERVSLADLQTLTGVIATRSAAEGVDPMMLLSSGASPADRERLRGQYVKAWGETGVGPSGEAAGKWIEAAREEINRSETVTGEVDLLECTARLAELSEAAARLWRGEVEAANAIVELAGVSADRVKGGSAGSLPGLRPETSEGDGRWLAQYLSAGRSIPERLQRLRELDDRGDPIGQADSELLVELACLETPSEVRAAAQRVVLKHVNSRVIVGALLKTLPRAPKYSTVSRMIEGVVHQSLPRPTDAAWEYEARRALVERLLELLAGAGDQAAVNKLAGLIWQSYAARTGGAVDPDADAAVDATAGAEASGAMWRSWRDAAEAVSPNPVSPVSLDVIDRRREGRVFLARGPIQRFAADQVGIAELMAYVVSAERVTRARDVAQVIHEMAEQRRKAPHVFDQLVAAERAMLRLWLIRFEVTP